MHFISNRRAVPKNEANPNNMKVYSLDPSRSNAVFPGVGHLLSESGQLERLNPGDREEVVEARDIAH
jgi:hypothetical protein